MELSFWERNTFFREADAVIIGSGIVGLNTARALKERHPSWRILVLERGILPYGASIRNAGFACFGSVGELVDDLKISSGDDVFTLVEKRWRGLQRLRELLGDEKIAYEPFGGYELFTADEEGHYHECMQHMELLNIELKRITGKPVYSNADERISEFGFHNVAHLLFNNAEGQIDTGKMMEALLIYVRQIGVEVFNGISIIGWEESNDAVLLKTTEGFSIRTQRMIVATNGFARELMPELEVIPGRAQVLITKPVDQLLFKGSFHSDRGYYYFRNVGNRVLFGGGRNLDFENEKTTSFGLTDLVQGRLEQMLREIILPRQKFEVEQRWSGIMGLGTTKSTIIKKLSPRIYCAVRMGGMGVAIGTLVGEQCAELVE
jgi:glycine/D-amino acid oxidase-like deaminating enzyme